MKTRLIFSDGLGKSSKRSSVYLCIIWILDLSVSPIMKLWQGYAKMTRVWRRMGVSWCTQVCKAVVGGETCTVNYYIVLQWSCFVSLTSPMQCKIHVDRSWLYCLRNLFMPAHDNWWLLQMVRLFEGPAYTCTLNNWWLQAIRQFEGAVYTCTHNWHKLKKSCPYVSVRIPVKLPSMMPAIGCTGALPCVELFQYIILGYRLGRYSLTLTIFKGQ